MVMNWFKLRTLLVLIPLVTISTIICGSASLLLAAFFRGGHVSHRIASLWAWSILKLCGVRVTVRGGQDLQTGHTYVVASNHQSLFDTPILFAYLPVSFRILYKRSLNWVPFLGWHLFMSGHVAVERDNPKRARKSLEHAAQRIRNGTSVVVFPEGTRSYDGTVKDFKKGSFRLAIEAGASIVPVTIVDSHLVMRRGSVTVYPRSIQIWIDKPISLTGHTEEQASQLMQEVRGVIMSNLSKGRDLQVQE